MDYRDLERGQASSNFWFRGKRDFINTLLSVSTKGKRLKILNLGAGTGEDLKVISQFGDVYVIDIDKRALDLVPEDLAKEKKLCDARNLSYPLHFFDLVVAFDVFEHVEEDWLVVREAYKVLKKGGKLIFSVPAFQSLYSSHDKALEHKRRYSKEDLKKILTDFEEKRLSYWNSFLFLPLSLLRIIKKKSKPRVDSGNSFFALDQVLFSILKGENYLIRKGFNFPFGLTLFGVYEK